LPVELFNGKKLGDYMINKYNLFDFNLQPENVVLRSENDMDDDSEEPMIQLINPRRQKQIEEDA
jgi:hypothetical protein